MPNELRTKKTCPHQGEAVPLDGETPPRDEQPTATTDNPPDPQSQGQPPRRPESPHQRVSWNSLPTLPIPVSFNMQINCSSYKKTFLTAHAWSNPWSMAATKTLLILICLQEKKRKNNARIMYQYECEPVNPILIMLPMIQYGALCLIGFVYT